MGSVFGKTRCDLNNGLVAQVPNLLYSLESAKHDMHVC